MKRIAFYEDGSVATFVELEGFHIDVEKRSLDGKTKDVREPIVVITNPTDEEFETAHNNPENIKFDKKTGKVRLLSK